MTNLHKNTLLTIFILLVFGVLVVFVFDLNCVFKSIFHIACPGCGLTRGFRALFHFDLIGAFNFNILTIPIFLFLVGLALCLFIDIAKKSNYLKNYYNFFIKHYYLIIILLVISGIINNIRGI